MKSIEFIEQVLKKIVLLFVPSIQNCVEFFFNAKSFLIPSTSEFRFMSLVNRFYIKLCSNDDKTLNKRKTHEFVSIFPSILTSLTNILPTHFFFAQPLKIPQQFKLKEKVSTIHFKLDRAFPFRLVKNSWPSTILTHEKAVEEKLQLWKRQHNR